MLVSVDWLKRHARDFDFVLLFVLAAISVMSFLAVYSSTVTRPDLENYYQRQLVWQIMGFVVFFLLVLTDYRIFTNRRLMWTGYAVTMFLLLIVLFFPAINGQKSWIPLPGFQLQPSEFGKLFAILGMAHYMAEMKKNEEPFAWKHFWRVTAIWLGPLTLIMLEPDLGQAMVMIGIFCAMMLVFLDRKPLILFGGIAGVLVAAYFLAITFFPQAYLKFVEHLPLKEYQKARFVVVIDPARAGDYGYQVKQAIIAVGNGGLPGRGLLQGSQTQGAFVPEQQTDMIFSAIGEDFGFIGASALIILFFIMLQRLTKIATTTTDPFGTYFITGAIGMFGFQIFENIGMNIAVMPATGITLPFVSYGGTSLLTNFIIMGIVQSVAIRRQKLRF